MELVDVPEPGAPGPGEVLLRPDAVGICGSDFHYFLGDLGFEVYPRIQGHEFSAIIEDVGPDCPAAARRGTARGGLAGPRLRALLPVPYRARRTCAST